MAKENVSYRKKQMVRCATLFIIPPILILFKWDTVAIVTAFFLSTVAALLTIFAKSSRISRIPFLWRLLVFYVVQLQLCRGVVWLKNNTNVLPNSAGSSEAIRGAQDFASGGGSAMAVGFLHQPKISVVLPCANEGEFMVKTVKSINEATPPNVLQEVVVVDDGSTPPLRTLLTEEEQKKLKIKWVRHSSFTGLINAKSKGAGVATGDIIIFLDCHVKPAENWFSPIIKNIKSNYKRVVVPTITNLDPDTWEEHRSGSGMAKCYLTWDADFKWFTDEDKYVPIMSGGLLAMSRQWWNETGGYDTRMIGWGGENIDQSLRIWLCGGEIVNAPDSYVAHMWRVASNPKTRPKYTVPGGAVVNNRYRAASAWFDDWIQKLETFPAFSGYGTGEKQKPDISNILEVKERLKCKPFAWFLYRFRALYFDAGLVPSEVFHLRDENSGMCLEARDATDVVLTQCSESSKGQLWHRGNRDGKKCCSGFRNWNTDQCISAGGLGDGLKTYTCSTYGEFWDQWIKLDNKQLKLYSQNPRGRSGCIGAEREKGAEVTIEDCGVPGYRQSFRVDRETGGIIEVGSGECLTASHDHFELLPCEIDPESGKVFGEQAITFTELKSNRYQLRASEVGEVPLCADSSSGTKLVLYSCYNPKMRNNNQEWEFLERFSDLGSNIKFGGTKCMSVLAGAKTTRKVFYDTCVTNNGLPKPGQRFEKDYSDSKSEFALRDGNWCLDVNEEGGVQVASCDGSSSQKWRSEADQISALVNIETSMCLQGDKDGDLSMSSCSFSPGDSQRWNLAENLVRGGEEDACIDYKPVRTTPLSVVSCPRARSIKWSIYEPFEPLETRLYREARGKYPKLLAGEVSHTDAPEGNIIEV